MPGMYSLQTQVFSCQMHHGFYMETVLPLAKRLTKMSWYYNNDTKDTKGKHALG